MSTIQPSHRRGAAVTERLLQTAIGLLAEHGPGVSIEDVAAEAGVHKTTVYRRWPDINTLITDAVRSHADAAIPITATGDVRADLRRLCRNVAENLGSPVGQALRRAAHLDGVEELRRGFWTERLTKAAELLTDELECATDRALSMDVVMEWLVAPIHFRINERGLPVDDNYLDALVDHFLHAITPTD